jgi:hypothetical protein
MSVQAMSWVFEHSTATLGARLVLLAVANHADKFGWNAWGSVATYAAEARLSVRQTQYALRKLAEIGELQGTGRHGIRADRATVVYRLPKMNPDEVQNPHPAQLDGVQSTTARGAESGTYGVQPIAPEPSLEPSLEPSKDLFFNDFWIHYPRHQGKGAARKAFERALNKADADMIIAGASRYREDPNRDDVYTCLPATWLNQERWDDDALPTRVNGDGKPDPPRPMTDGEMAQWLEDYA